MGGGAAVVALAGSPETRVMTVLQPSPVDGGLSLCGVKHGALVPEVSEEILPPRFQMVGIVQELVECGLGTIVYIAVGIDLGHVCGGLIVPRPVHHSGIEGRGAIGKQVLKTEVRRREKL